MPRKLVVGCFAIPTLALALFGQSANTQRSTGAVASSDAERAVITRYCLACHSQNARKAGVESALRITLDDLDTAHIDKNPEERECLVRKIRARMMPPSA